MMMTPLRNPSDPNRAYETGLLRDGNVPAVAGFMEWAGLKGKTLYADYEFLYGRHWRYFKDQEHARAAVELVLSRPEQVQDMNGGKNASFVGVDELTCAIYRIEIEKRVKNKRNHIRSVFQITPEQYKKIKLEAPRVLQPSQTEATNDNQNARTLSSFLRYDTPGNKKVKSELHKKPNFNGKEKHTMQTTPEMYQLSPLELTLTIRAAEAQNSLEYMYLVCKSGTIRAENQLDAMHLTSLMKNNPDLLQNAKNVLEVRREVEFHKLIGKQETPVEKTAGQTVEKISGQAAEKAVQQPEVKKEYKSSLLVALKYAVDMAVYRCKAAIMAVNNAALKNSLSALEKVQVQVSQLEQLKDKELNLQQQISGNVPKQPKTSDEDLLSPKVAASESKPSDEDLLSPKVSTAIESVPAKKESADSAKMKI